MAIRQQLLGWVTALLTDSSSALVSKNALAKVHTDVARVMIHRDKIEFPAQIESEITAKVHAETKGWVEKLHVGLGDHVQKGTLLAVLQNKDPIYHYSKLKIRAPISGVISKKCVAEGSFVGATDTIAEIMDPQALIIRTHVPMLEHHWIHLGKEAFFEGPVKQRVIAKRVSPMADQKIGTFAVEWELADTPPSGYPTLKAGMHGRVITYTREVERILIPEQAILYRKGSCFVSVINEKGPETIVSLRPVAVGDRRSSQIEITDGLLQGERFVVKSSRILRPGERVLLDD